MRTNLSPFSAVPLFALVCLLFALKTVRAAERPPANLPEGNAGIAARYPGDAGIAKDSAVVFHDDFEDCRQPADLRRKWEEVVHAGNMRIARETATIHIGQRALEFTVPKQEEPLEIGVQKVLKREYDVLFLRFYSKYEKGFETPINRSCHNGGSISAHYFIDGRATPGERADGWNKFIANFESESGYRGGTPSPGLLNIYCYHPQQRTEYGDHLFPSGRIMPFAESPPPYGPHFTPRPDVLLERDRWYCFEYMVQANTPGKRDGRIACWVDGKLIADFTDLMLRDVDTLKIERFGIGLFIAHNTERANTKWYDDVIAATSYIGPRLDAKPKQAPGPARGGR